MKLVYTKDSRGEFWQLAMWDEYHQDWEILPGVMTTKIAAYSKLQGMQSFRGRDVLGFPISDAEERRERRKYIADVYNKAKAEYGYDFSEEALATPSGETSDETPDEIHYVKGFPFPDDEPWRRVPPNIEILKLTARWGADIQNKWLDGVDKYGDIFVGDPVTHAIKENEDQRVYLEYIARQREWLLLIIDKQQLEIDSLEDRLKTQHSRFTRILTSNGFDIIDDSLVPSIIGNRQVKDSTEIINLLREIRDKNNKENP